MKRGLRSFQSCACRVDHRYAVELMESEVSQSAGVFPLTLSLNDALRAQGTARKLHCFDRHPGRLPWATVHLPVMAQVVHIGSRLPVPRMTSVVMISVIGFIFACTRHITTIAHADPHLNIPRTCLNRDRNGSIRSRCDLAA